MSINRLPLFISKCCSVIVFFIGLTVVIIWYTHSTLLIQLSPASITMQFNTAISFMLAGIGLITAIYNKRRISFLCGLFIGIIGSLTILQYILNIDLGLGPFFFKPPPLVVNTLYPGRMSLITAWGLLFTALMLISTSFPDGKLKFFYTHVTASVMLILGIVPLAGYLSGLEIAYSLGQLTPIAFHTAFAFLLLGVGTNAYILHIDMLKTGNMSATWFSTLATLTVFLFTLTVWHQSLKKEYEFTHERVQEAANRIQNNIFNQINNSVTGLRRMVLRWQIRGGTPKKEWSADARNYLLDIKALSSVEWINSSYRVQWLESLNENVADQYAAFDEKQKRILKGALNHSSITLTPPLDLANGERGFITYLPIYRGQDFQGFIAGVYNIKKLVDGAFSPQMHDLFNISLIDEEEPLYNSTQNNLLFTKSFQIVFNVFNREWILNISPKEKFFTQQISSVPNLELIGGSIFSLLMGIAIYSAITAIQRSKQLNEKSEALSKSESRQRQILDEVQDYAIYWLDLNGNVEGWNKGAERILKYKSHEIIGRNHALFYREEDQKNGLPQQVLDRAVNNKKFKRDGWLVRKDGTKIWTSKIVETVKNAAGELMGFAIFTQDISERRLLEMEKSRLIETINESPDFIGMADLDGHLLYHNHGAKKMVGLPLNYDMSNMNIADMYPGWAYKVILEIGIPTALNQGYWNGETAIINHQSGREIPVIQTLTLHRDEQKKPIYLTNFIRDITERKKFEEALKTSEEIFRSAMEHASIGMALVSLDGNWLKVNQSLCQIVGYSESELLKINFQVITHPDDLEKDLNNVYQLLAGKIITYQTEKRYIRKDGSIVWILLSSSLLRDVENKPLYFISQIQNIDKQKKLELELKYMAYHDILTGLFNRKQLEISFKLVLAYAKRHKTPMAIMFMDLDYFKTINDQYGHDIGDLVLIEVASRLKLLVRATDILVRLGGDEFIIVITELTSIQQSIEVAKKILNSVAIPMKIKKHHITIAASIGISFYPKDGHNLKTLTKNADKALYAVKLEGKNNIRLYFPE